MIAAIESIGFGGGCHWCTEAIFQSVTGVSSVEQGYIASTEEYSNLSEGVIVNYYSKSVNLKTLIEIHLTTHNSHQNHSMRDKYRSAIYSFSGTQKNDVINNLEMLRNESGIEFLTKVLDFDRFSSSRNDIQNYYFSDPTKPFCRQYIDPKLKKLIQSYGNVLKMNKLKHLV